MECVSCDSGFTLMYTPVTQSTPFSVNHYSEVNWDEEPSIPHCKGYDPNDKTLCTECSDDYVVVTQDETLAKGRKCAPITGDPLDDDYLLENCLSVIDTLE